MTIIKQPMDGYPNSSHDVINNFSITVATVNGSGSQTSNLTLLRALFKMGIPVSGKNIFPSNIQGLPTWYSIRVNREGFLARKDKSEIVVAMNPDTFQKDLKDVLPGGVFYYADDIKEPIDRNDIIIYPMPVRRLVRESDIPSNLRNYIANMVYVGILAWMMGIDMGHIRHALEFHFKGKKTPIDLNYNMVQTAYEWTSMNISKKDPFRVEPMESTSDWMLADGNTAAALGAVYGGVHFMAWYPITPATSLAETLQSYLPVLRRDPETGRNTFAVVQAEDELAAIGMAIGAGWGGLRAMTSTSGPGFSLMTEYIGLAYYSEVPVVVWDIQRAGPSTGLPTRTAQGDLIFAHFIGHGDTQIVLLMPGSINECFEFGWRAFDLAEKLQTPVIVLSDLDFGMNQWMAKPFEYPDSPVDRGKVLWEEGLDRLKGEWVRYKDIDGDFIPYRTLPGNRHPLAAYFARGTGHDENGMYSEDPADWHNLLERLKNKFESARSIVPDPVFDIQPGAEIGIIAYGSTESAIQESRQHLTNMDIKTDFMRLRAVPFSQKVGTFIHDHRRNYIVELNRDGQLLKLLTLDFPALAPLMASIAYTDGLPLTAERVNESVISQEEMYHD